MRPYNLRKPGPIADRFWKRVDKTDHCWLWTGHRNRKGYGRLSREGARGGLVLAHRLSWEMVNGEVPPGRIIRHICDVRNCVRPDHLALSTQAENVADAMQKHVHRPPTPTRITDGQARLILARVRRGETHQAVATSMRVSRTTVSNVVNGKRRWGYLHE